MRQKSLSPDGYNKYRKTTKKEKFLSEMDKIISWKELTEVIEPFYPKPQGAGRRPIGIERMLRITDLGSSSFIAVNRYLEENGIKVRTGTIVDATIINAPSSTKNKDRQRDPDMHQTRKGNQWYFGMKAHIGVDSRTRLIHSVAATAANVHDSQVLEDLLHGEGRRLYGDSAYTGQKETLSEHAPHAKDFAQKKAFRNKPLTEQDKSPNKNKSSIRSIVEHVFHVIKRQFGFVKLRYKGFDKNVNHLFACCDLTNLVLMKKRLPQV